MSKFLLFAFCIAAGVLASFSAAPDTDGKSIYQQKCARCHGKSGSKGTLGAKNLQKSTLDDAAINQIILNGKRIMPAYKSKLSLEEVAEVSKYVVSLRK